MVQGSPESRERVVLQIRGRRASTVAMEAAVRMARALSGELEGVFVEDEHLFSLAALPFAREISFTGRRSRPLSPDVVQREMRAASAMMQHELERLARSAGVPARFSVIRDEPERALRSASSRASVLALCDPFMSGAFGDLSDVTACLTELMGCLLVGAAARRARGRVIVVLDLLANALELLRAGERFSVAAREELTVLSMGEARAAGEHVHELLSHGLSGRVPVLLEREGGESASDLVKTVKRLSGGLLIAGFGGSVLPGETELARVTAALECPLLLLRRGAAPAQPEPEGAEPETLGSTSSRT